MYENFNLEFEAMGTKLCVKIFDIIPKTVQEKIKIEILDYTYSYDEQYSRFKENSLVTKIFQEPGIYIVPSEFMFILKKYIEFNMLTEGAVNPLIGETLSDLGYDASYRLTKKEAIKKTPKLESALKIINQTTIETFDKVLIDIGALGKGFWCDKIVEILNKYNLKKFLVDGSGDIYFKNTLDDEELKVGLEDPSEPGKILGYVSIKNKSICGSGTSKRNWSLKESDNLHHVVDANTNKPTKGIQSVWVVANDTTTADALATCLFFIDVSDIKMKLKDYNFEYLIIKNKQEIFRSENFQIKN